MNIRIESAITQPQKVAPKEFAYGRFYANGSRSLVLFRTGQDLVTSFGGSGVVHYSITTLSGAAIYDEIEVEEILIKIKEVR